MADLANRYLPPEVLRVDQEIFLSFFLTKLIMDVPGITELKHSPHRREFVFLTGLGQFFTLFEAHPCEAEKTAMQTVQTEGNTRFG
jgi:hypothetical protein